MPNFVKISQKVVKILRFFKMAVVAILNFQNCEFLFARVFCRAQTHQCIKFCQNRSLRCGDIAIFRLFKMAAAVLDFWNCIILFVIVVQTVLMHQHPKFCRNRSIGCEDIKIFWFSSAILDYFEAYLDHLRWVLIFLYHCAKFGYDQCSCFYNMHISIFGTFGWKTPQNCFFGQFDPLNGLQY